MPGRRSAAVAKVCSLGGWIVLLIFLVAILLDVLGKRYPVSTLAGFTVGSLIVLFKFQGEEYRRRRRYGVAMLVVCLTALVAMLVLPEGLTDPIHVQPPAVLREPLEEMQEQGDPAWGKEESSLLLYHSSWHRYGAPDEWLQVEVWTARGDRLADWVWQQTMRELRENGTPEAEGTDVWRVMLGENDDLWLLRRGTTVLWLEGSEGFLTPLLAQLQEVEL